MTIINREHWQLFLKDLAIESKLSKTQTDVLLCVFDLGNKGKRKAIILQTLRENNSQYDVSDTFYRNHFGDLFDRLKVLCSEKNKPGKSEWIQYLNIEYDGVTKLGVDNSERIKCLNAEYDKARKLDIDNIDAKKIDAKKAGEHGKKIQTEVLKNEELTREGSIWKGLEDAYPHWQKEKQIVTIEPIQSTQELWSRLKDLGKYAPERMGIYISENKIQKASAVRRSSQSNQFLEEVPKSTPGVHFKILNQGIKKVLLLNRDANQVLCLCPSALAPSINTDKEQKVVPSIGVDSLGREEWWGWIVDEMPPLSWLEAAFQASSTEDKALQLSAKQLAELLNWVELQKGEVLYTSYQVV